MPMVRLILPTVRRIDDGDNDFWFGFEQEYFPLGPGNG